MSLPTVTLSEWRDMLAKQLSRPQMTLQEAWEERLRLVADQLKRWRSSSPGYAHYTDEDWIAMAAGAPNVILPRIKP